MNYFLFTADLKQFTHKQLNLQLLRASRSNPKYNPATKQLKKQIEQTKISGN